MLTAKNLFKFFNFWMKHHKFKELVSSSWSIPISGSAMLRLSLKLKRLKPILSDLNATCFSNISGRVVEGRQNLEHFQRLCSQNIGNHDLRLQEHEEIRVFMELSGAEESFKKQKSRVHWLALGDQNTKFFHRKVSSNRTRNKILSLMSVEGVRLDKPEEIQQFDKGLLGTKFSQRQDARDCLQQIITKKVPAAMHNDLIKPVSVEEIKCALKAIKGDKALGLMGFAPASFNRIGRLCVLI